MNIVVVGTSHGGYEAVKTVLENYPEAKVKLFEQSDKVSFLSCGIQLYLEGAVQDINYIHYATKEGYSDQGVDVYTRNQVIGLDPNQKKIRVKNLDTGEVYNETYDKLILAPGAVPRKLPFKGNDLENVYFLRGREWALKNKAKIDDPAISDVVVIGSGYIGIELVEAYAKAGKHVTVIDVTERILPTYLDQEFTDILMADLKKRGIAVRTGEFVQEIQGEDGKASAVITDKGTYPADLVVEAAGVVPNTDWLKGTLDLNPNGTIVVDAYQKTSAPDVFAAGDACMIKYNPTGKEQNIALATNARRQGVAAALNLEKPTLKIEGVSGTSALSLFDYKFASTGIKDATAAKSGLETRSVYIENYYRPAFVPGTEKVYMKLTYEVGTDRIVGAQLMSKHDITAAINTLSLAIATKQTTQQLAFADFFFQPEFDQQWNYLCELAKAAYKQAKKIQPVAL
ncbi:FAD-dependent oxidoreductase [Sporolactobacillus shoreicorticis]|uniref:FAD-dependent oxidoreductase n=1 Tax=Sporolactobacillus shoreicorticis TaxID=1923877 RepID=UPI00209706C3|nr:FAD-dependent oxidoreductase [Sporolactobacillus shoreicorticis]MCO7127592.1 FAD-dependent oxidoreductase [Sporolactobacillus shoreicorticis]